MPLLALLWKGLMGNAFALILALKSTERGIKITAALILAAAYIICVTLFTNYVSPLIGQLFNTTHGYVIGLAFPPIAGTVIAGFVGLWVSIVAQRYYRWVMKIGVG